MTSNSITDKLLRKTAAYVAGFELNGSEDKVTAARPWQTWLDAELGFRNNWYPAEASRNIRDGDHKPITILGEELLFIRRAGRLFAIEDRCSHRGTRFSKRPLHYTDDTITCWHHAFVFNLDDGRIRCILNDPDSPLCGQTGIKSYPVREEKGVVFVFIGDIEPPPLVEDVPPGFLDDDVAVCVADPYIVESNWRLGCEGGYDPGHHFIHNWSLHSINARLPMSFGWVSERDGILKTARYETREHGAKGFTRFGGETAPEMTAVIPRRNGSAPKEVVISIAKEVSPEEVFAIHKDIIDTTVGLWMPCGLKVDPWPFKGVVHNEFYVPRDANSHYYFQCGWKRVANDEERIDWEKGELGQVRWKVPVVDCFTVDDAMAREGIAKFYGEEDGWNQEQLVRADVELLMWRVFAGEHCRGVQKEQHERGLFKRNFPPAGKSDTQNA